MYATSIDIEDRKRTEAALRWSEALLAGQKRVLEMVAKGEALPRILEALCRVVEEQSSDILSSFLLLDANGTHLRHGAAPRLPQSYIDAIDGIAIGPTGGSCITAAYRAAPVVVSDIAADPLWAAYRDLPLAHGLRACWSTPIISSEGTVLGTFAMYYREPRSPSPQDLYVLEQVASVAAVSIKQKQAEESLRRSEAYLSEAQRLSHTGSFGWRVSNGEILWSEETFRIFQCDRATKPTVELIVQRTHPEDRALVQQIIERASQDGKDFDFEHRLLMPDGSVKHVRVVGHAKRDQSGELEFVGAVMDVTAATQAEERIRQDERELRITLETIPASVSSTLPDGSVDFVSQSWLDYAGCSKEEILGWGWKQTIHPEDLDRVLNNWQAALAAGKSLEIELRRRGADSKYRWFLSRAVPLRDEKGNIVKWYATTFDIEDRKQAEEKLRRSEAYLAEAQRLTHTGSWAVNVATGERSHSSAEHFRLFGFDPERGVPSGKELLQRIHPEDRDRIRETFERAVGERADVEVDYRNVLPDGTIKFLRSVGHPVFTAAGDLVEYIGTTMDVTEHKRAAEVLQRSENRFRAMVEKSAEGILLLLPNRDIIYASPSVERVLGYTPEELTVQSLIDHCHQDYRQHATDTWTQLLQDPDHVSTGEAMIRHKDGSWRWIESTTRNLLHEPSVQAVVVNFRDITERKLAQAERERLEQRLRQAEKMEAVGRLAGGIAHDFNNVLAGIFAYGEMLFEETPGDSPLKRYAQNVLTAATTWPRAGRADPRLQPQPARQARAGRHRSRRGRDARAAQRLAPLGHPSRGERARAASRRDRRRHPTAPGGDEPVQQRDPGHEWRRHLARGARGHRDRGRASALARNARAGSLREPERRGQRIRHGRGDALAHFRAVLHHQGDRPRHRSRPGAGVRDRHRLGWRDRREERAQAGHHDYDLRAAGGGRAGRCR